MDSYYDLMKDIRFNSSNYIEEKNLYRLNSFFDGYLIALELMDILNLLFVKERRNFHDYVLAHIKINSAKSIYSHLILFSKNDEFAYDMYFEWHDKYYNKGNGVEPFIYNDTYKIPSLINLLDKIKKKPTLYLLPDTFNILKSYLQGFYYVANQFDYYDNLDFNIKNFERWINDKYNFDNFKWDKIIEFFYPNSHRALLAFFDEYKQFIEEMK